MNDLRLESVHLKSSVPIHLSSLAVFSFRPVVKLRERSQSALFLQVCQSPENGASYDKIGDQSTASCDTKTEPPKLLYKTA